MKKIKVEVCVCTGCVMNGATEILEAIESLQELKEQMIPDVNEESSFEIITSKCLDGKQHHEQSPLLYIDGEIFSRANSETVMSHLISMTREHA